MSERRRKKNRPQPGPLRRTGEPYSGVTDEMAHPEYWEDGSFCSGSDNGGSYGSDSPSSSE